MAHSSGFENVLHKATVLIDSVLEESIHIVNEQHSYIHSKAYNVDVDNNTKAEYNSESENYAITCDDVGGLDVIKSPTIESISGKSFDDNLSFTDEHISTIVTQATISKRLSQEQIQISPMDEMCRTVRTPVAQETKSTDITPILPTMITMPSPTVDISSSTKSIDVPKPKPRSVKISTPTENDDKEEESQKTNAQLTSKGDDHGDVLDQSFVPVPKPRSQMKTPDAFKNLDSFNEQKTLQQHQSSQSDSVNIRSFDYTEESSYTDDPLVSVTETKSQYADYPPETTSMETTATTTSENPETESLDLPSELSIDEGNDTERRTSFYIGESSRNIITKTTPTNLSTSGEAADEPLTGVMTKDHVGVYDISLIKEFSVDFDEESDVFKEYETIKPKKPEEGIRIRRQSSETRNDLLEDDVVNKETIDSTTVAITTAIPSVGVIEYRETLGKSNESFPNISQSSYINRPTKLDFPHGKSEWETIEQELIPLKIGKTVHSPQQHILSDLTKEDLTEEIVKETLEEVQQSLDAAKNELKSVLNDTKSIKESPSEFEFRPFSQAIANTGGTFNREQVTNLDLKTKVIVGETAEQTEGQDISTFIGVPEDIQDKLRCQETEKIMIDSVIDNLNKDFNEKKIETSLGFISTETAGSYDSHTSIKDNIVKGERASLGFISSETAEDVCSMEEYFHKKLDEANIVNQPKEEEFKKVIVSPTEGDKLEEVISVLTIKPFEDMVHPIGADNINITQNPWSVPEVDQSSSSESYYKSFEKTESHPLSSDIENIITQANSSDYQTAADILSACRETTEFMSAVSTFDGISKRTLSSHESMRSLDSQSETSANLGSIDVSEFSETLVGSSTTQTEEIQRLRDLANEEDSDDSLDIETSDYTCNEIKNHKQCQMKRSQEMIFKPKSEEISKNAKTIECEKPKEIEKTWDLTYPMEETIVDNLEDDILLHHGDLKCSIDDSKYASSLDEGSILSVSMSSMSNIGSVVENFEDVLVSVGTSSFAGIEAYEASSLPEETTFVIEMEGKSENLPPKDSSPTMSLEDLPTNRSQKLSETTSFVENEMKKIPNQDASASHCEGKESESESDTDPYETEYARQFRSPSERKSKKKMQAAVETDYCFETEKRSFTPSQLVAEIIVEDSLTEELEAEECHTEERRPSQNILNYSNIPDITITEDTKPKSPILKEDTFGEKILYKVKTEEQLHKATDDRPLHEEKTISLEEENFQKLVQEQYKQKLAEIKKTEINDSNYVYNKTPDSPDSFEMVDQPDISDEFVIIEEVAKEANEEELGGKSIRIASTKYESKHDEEIEKIIIKSAPADPKLGSQILRDDLSFEFEESPPTAASGGTGSKVQDESDSGPDMATNKRWVEMQLTDNQLRYPYDLAGGVLEDIKEEDGEFEVGSSRISSFKDSFSSTPEYDTITARKYYATRGEHDDISMSSLQEFESLEQAISLENRNRTHQGSTDSSNGSFQRRYILRNSSGGLGTQGDDVSISSLKEFEGLENACIEAHLIEIKAKEEAALLSRSDESSKSNGSDNEKIVDLTGNITKVIRTLTHTKISQLNEQPPDIEILLKQKLPECEQAQRFIQITNICKTKNDSDNLETTRSLELIASNVKDSLNISKDGTTKSDIDSLQVDVCQPKPDKTIESFEIEHIDNVVSKFITTLGESVTKTTTTTTASSDSVGYEDTSTKKRIILNSSVFDCGTNTSSLEMIPKDYSESFNQTTTSSPKTTDTFLPSGDSQMPESITSFASTTLMEDSVINTADLTMSSSYVSQEEEKTKETVDLKAQDTLNVKDRPAPH